MESTTQPLMPWKVLSLAAPTTVVMGLASWIFAVEGLATAPFRWLTGALTLGALLLVVAGLV